jgi:hypothetical protein
LPAGLKVDLELDGSVKDDRGTDKLGPTTWRIVGQVDAGPQGQRVRDSYQTGSGAQIRVENGRIGLIALARLDNILWPYKEVPTVGPVEQPAQHWLRVESRHAQPANRSVQSDKRGRAAVANESHVLEPQISVVPLDRSEAWLNRQHLACSEVRLSASASASYCQSS